MARFSRLTGLLLSLFVSHRVALADTVYGTGSFVSFPMLGSGTAFWDNASRDGPASCGTNSACSGMNIGYFLTDSGNFPALCTYYGPPSTPNSACGTDYLGSQGQYYAQSSNSPNAPSNFGFLSSSLSIQISLLGAYGAKDFANNNPYSGNDPTTFGYYDASQNTLAGATASEVNIYGSGSLPAALGTTQSILPAYANYGFYVTVCQSTVLIGATWVCTATDTYFTNSSLNPAGAHQQFALFTLASNPTTYFIGVEDNLSYDAVEGWGDYQDIVLKIGSSGLAPPLPTPEPVTFPLVGVGLLALLTTLRQVRQSGRTFNSCGLPLSSESQTESFAPARNTQSNVRK
ncbi:MAG TPA: hypothetical protein VKV74_09595 [Bryobacteraceae bacterium]|nr:hypothetical protein [Bryobacteraceae bacterium]